MVWMEDDFEVAGKPARAYRSRDTGPALVLLHGAGANGRIWEPVAAALSGFEIWAPSLPGRDGTGGEPPTSAAEAAAWLATWLDAARLPHPIVVGHSYGGAVAIELALARPSVPGLVLAGTGARLRVAPAVLQVAEDAAARGEHMSTRPSFGASVPDAITGPYDRAAQRTPSTTSLADWRSCNGFDRMDALSEITVPVLVVGGETDTLTPPKYHRYLADGLPRATLEMIPDVGHMLPFEAPETFARLLRTWAAGIG